MWHTVSFSFFLFTRHMASDVDFRQVLENFWHKQDIVEPPYFYGLLDRSHVNYINKVYYSSKTI